MNRLRPLFFGLALVLGMSQAGWADESTSVESDEAAESAEGDAADASNDSDDTSSAEESTTESTKDEAEAASDEADDAAKSGGIPKDAKPKRVPLKVGDLTGKKPLPVKRIPGAILKKKGAESGAEPGAESGAKPEASGQSGVTEGPTNGATQDGAAPKGGEKDAKPRKPEKAAKEKKAQGKKSKSRSKMSKAERVAAEQSIRARLDGHISHANTGNLDAYLADFGERGTKDEALKAFSERALSLKPQLEILDVGIARLKKTSAKVVVELLATFEIDGEPHTQLAHQEFHLKKSGDDWFITKTKTYRVAESDGDL